MKKLYHITSGNHVQSILKNGIQLQLDERNRRFGGKCGIYVTDSYSGALNLSRMIMWNTHPMFLEHGQHLFEVLTEEKGTRDLMFDHGIILMKMIPSGRVRYVGEMNKKTARDLMNQRSMYV